jgi:hypothetical protein
MYTYEKGIVMLHSTLPDLREQRYIVAGMVSYDCVVQNSGEGFDLPMIFRHLDEHATQLSVDAIIDIRVTRINRRHIIVTGTAIQRQMPSVGTGTVMQ